jgi:hypothetical protein
MRRVSQKKDYWQITVDKLQEKDSSVADQIAKVQQAAAEACNPDFTAQLVHTTQQGQQSFEAKRWKITRGSRELVLRDQGDRPVEVVTFFKGVVSLRVKYGFGVVPKWPMPIFYSG